CMRRWGRRRSCCSIRAATTARRSGSLAHCRTTTTIALSNWYREASTMRIKTLFQKDIARPINGVVKADQLDASSVGQELDQFVVTRELNQHLPTFVAAYCDASDHPHDPTTSG